MASLQGTTAFGYDNFFRTTLSSDVTASATDIFLDAVPTATEGTLIIDPDSTANREIIFYNSKTATKVTCPSAALGRGYDNTTGVSHTAGTTVIMAPIADWFNSIQTGQVLDDSSITTAKIADDAVTAAKIDGIDKSLLTTDSNPYKFHVTSNAGLSVGTAATQLQWQVEIFDTNNNFATNQYTAPVAGFYRFYAYIHLGGHASATSASMNVYKNGADFAKIAYEEATNQGYGMEGSILMSLAASDTVRIYISTTGNAVTSIASGTDVPFFGGYLVSRT
jgi:hypothetical protein